MSFHYLTSKAETRNYSVHNKGTFATKLIKKGELIAIFGGKVMDFPTWDKLPKELNEVSIQIHDDFLIGPNNIKDLGTGDYINHSCEPNSGIKGQIFLEAMKNISPNEEITFDYCTVAAGPYFEFECNCGSNNCRKKLTTEDWKNSELQKKYKGYFSYFLEKKINKK